MNSVDHCIDQRLAPVFKMVQKHFTVFSASVLMLLMAAFFIKILGERPSFMASIVHSDLKIIAAALEKIDRECTVTSVSGGRTAINFLTVKKFVGSVVGGLDLMMPEKWQGQYLEVNPTLQQQYYELVLAHDGYYVVPGRGVVLPNGYTVGKEFELNGDSDVSKMLQPGGFLHYKGESLAVVVTFSRLAIGSSLHMVSKKVEKINTMIQEFNQALPFAHNDKAAANVKI